MCLNVNIDYSYPHFGTISGFQNPGQKVKVSLFGSAAFDNNSTINLPLLRQQGFHKRSHKNDDLIVGMFVKLSELSSFPRAAPVQRTPKYCGPQKQLK